MPEQSRGDRQTDCASPGALGDMAHARDGSAPRKEGLSTAYDQGTDQHRTDREKKKHGQHGRVNSTSWDGMEMANFSVYVPTSGESTT